MKKQKIITSIASIALLSTSLLTFIPNYSYGYIGNINEKIYTNGNQVIRTYSSNNYESTSINNQSSQNNSENSAISSNSNEKVYAYGGRVIRYYGTSTNNTEDDTAPIPDSAPDTTNKASNNASNTNENTNNNSNIVDNTYNSNVKIYSSGGQITRVYGSQSSTNVSNDNTTSTNGDSISSNNNVYTSILSENTIESLVAEMFNLINEERTLQGLQPLKLSDKLTEVAQLKAEDMVKYDYLSHTSRSYGSIYSMISNAGIKYYNAGENIAKASSINVAHNNFMNSYLHRKAILAPHFTHVGIGIDKHQRGMYKISVMFIEEK